MADTITYTQLHNVALNLLDGTRGFSPTSLDYPILYGHDHSLIPSLASTLTLLKSLGSMNTASMNTIQQSEF